jgi:CRP/FNR family transcriptional regulator, cyclic AMP receptor protein
VESRDGAILARTQLFAPLSPAALDQVAAHVFVRSWRKGQLVFQEGDPGDQLYVVASGLVKLTRTSSDGCPLLLAVRRPPDAFGEVALIDGGPRLAAAETVQPTRLLTMPRDTFFRLAGEHPVLMESYLGALGRLLRTVLERGSDLVFLDLSARVAKVLLELAADPDARTEETVIDLHLTQTDLASMAGGSRPAVNKILRGFAQRGYIAPDGRMMVLKEPAQLRRRAGIKEDLLPILRAF